MAIPNPIISSIKNPKEVSSLRITENKKNREFSISDPLEFKRSFVEKKSIIDQKSFKELDNPSLPEETKKGTTVQGQVLFTIRTGKSILSNIPLEKKEV